MVSGFRVCPALSGSFAVLRCWGWDGSLGTCVSSRSSCEGTGLLGGHGRGPSMALSGWEAWGAGDMTGQGWGFIEHLLRADAFRTLPLLTLHQMSGVGAFTLRLAAEAHRANPWWTQEPGANHWSARPSEGSLLSSWLCPPLPLSPQHSCCSSSPR